MNFVLGGHCSFVSNASPDGTVALWHGCPLQIARTESIEKSPRLIFVLACLPHVFRLALRRCL